MRRTLALLALLLPAAARANNLHGYYDLIVPEVVGEIGERKYDLRQVIDKDTNALLGNQVVKGGYYPGAGIGVRVLVVQESGLLLGGELSITGGRMQGAELPWGAQSVAMHYGMLGYLGYGLSLGDRAM